MDGGQRGLLGVPEDLDSYAFDPECDGDNVLWR